MSKTTTIILSVICFIILVLFIICEQKNPEAGYELLHGMGVM